MDMGDDGPSSLLQHGDEAARGFLGIAPAPFRTIPLLIAEVVAVSPNGGSVRGWPRLPGRTPSVRASGQLYDAGPIRSHLLPAMSRNTATWP